MQKEMGIRDVARLLDRLSVSESSSELAARFQRGNPYPHLVLDNMFDPALLEAVSSEMSHTRDKDWLHHNTGEFEKLGQKSAASLQAAGFELFCLLQSAPFLYFLSEITGMWNLLADPYLHGAGFSIIPSHAKFDVHVDLNADTTNGLTRRLVLIVYLNHDWKPEYGGQLELWDEQAQHRVTSMEPVFNRTVLMEISESAYHGIAPVVEPTGRSRNSFMVYYNTAGEILGKDQGVHSSMYAPSCYRQKPTFKTVLRRWTPPAIFDFVRRINN